MTRGTPTSTVRAAANRALLGMVWFYRQAISPWTPRTCRFYPSCSAYAEEALRRHGPMRGGWLAIRRLGRCHPWTPGGVDHVPGHELDATPPVGSSSTSSSASPSTSTGA